MYTYLSFSVDLKFPLPEKRTKKVKLENVTCHSWDSHDHLMDMDKTTKTFSWA